MTESEQCPEPGHPTKWTMHVHGPDDLIYFDTEEVARRTAQDMTEWWAQLDHSSPLEPSMAWHVIPPAGVIAEGPVAP